jgi:hypothetical protein
MGLVIDGLLIVATPLVKKNPPNMPARRAPVVLSMARVEMSEFAVAALTQL